MGSARISNLFKGGEHLKRIWLATMPFRQVVLLDCADRQACLTALTERNEGQPGEKTR